MVDCLSCPKDGTKEHRITSIDVNPQVKEGDRYTILISHVIKAWFGTRYCRICLYDGNTNVANSGSIRIAAKTKEVTKFTGIMPNHDLYLKASLQAEAFGFVEDCQDAADILIRLAPPGSPTIPIVPEEPDENNDEDDEDVIDWLIENTVIILLLVLVIILVIKFG